MAVLWAEILLSMIGMYFAVPPTCLASVTNLTAVYQQQFIKCLWQGKNTSKSSVLLYIAYVAFGEGSKEKQTLDGIGCQENIISK